MGLGLADWVFWLILAGGFLLLEALTVNLVSIWFVLGSLCAALAAYLGLSRLVQIVLMVLISGICFWLYWHFHGRFRLRSDQIPPTNADRIVHQEGIVIEAITSQPVQGVIQVLGQSWSALSESGEEIPVGTLVQVSELRGVRAVVKPVVAPHEE